MIQTILTALALITSSGVDQATYDIDTKASSVEWLGKKVTGEHTGTVSLKEGAFVFEQGKLVGGNFIVDMSTIDNSDLSGEWKDKLVGHLKSDDFFGVEKYPTSKFVMTKVVPQGPGKYKVIGDLTIKESTQSIQFNADLKEENGKVIGVARLTIDRSKYNVRYGSGSFFDDLGDKTIYDNFDLTVNIVADQN